MFLISIGSKFHNLGAAMVNDLSPIVAADYFLQLWGLQYSIVRPKTIFSLLSDMQEAGSVQRCHIMQCFKSNQDDLKTSSSQNKWQHKRQQ